MKESECRVICGSSFLFVVALHQGFFSFSVFVPRQKPIDVFLNSIKPFPSCLFPFLSKRVLVHKLSCGNEFDLQDVQENFISILKVVHQHSFRNGGKSNSERLIRTGINGRRVCGMCRCRFLLFLFIC